jgi:hypothetical protein
MDHLSNKISSAVDILDLLDEESRRKFDMLSFDHVNKINDELLFIEKLIISLEIKNINIDSLDERKEKILNQCLFIVYWHLHNKLEPLTNEQIEKIEESKNKLSDCLQHITFEQETARNE